MSAYITGRDRAMRKITGIVGIGVVSIFLLMITVFAASQPVTQQYPYTYDNSYLYDQTPNVPPPHADYIYQGHAEPTYSRTAAPGQASAQHDDSYSIARHDPRVDEQVLAHEEPVDRRVQVRDDRRVDRTDPRITDDRLRDRVRVDYRDRHPREDLRIREDVRVEDGRHRVDTRVRHDDRHRVDDRIRHDRHDDHVRERPVDDRKKVEDRKKVVGHDRDRKKDDGRILERERETVERRITIIEERTERILERIRSGK